MKASELIRMLECGELDSSLKRVYVTDEAVREQKPRYIRTAKKFIEQFDDDRDVIVLSAPGRTDMRKSH